MKASLPQLPCMCASLRRTARAVSQLYDAGLRPVGMRLSQFTILQALSLAGEVTQGQLGEILAMDSTTLTRTLAIMDRAGWIARQRGDDRRQWRLKLSRAGRAQFHRAIPYWEKTQSGLRRKLGETRWNEYMNFTNQLTHAVIGNEP